MKIRLEKIKSHFQENWEVYAVGTICLVMGAILDQHVGKSNINDSFNNNIDSFNTNIYPRHNRSHSYRDPETGIPYGSIHQASNVTGKSRNYIRDNWEFLGEVA